MGVLVGIHGTYPDESEAHMHISRYEPNSRFSQVVEYNGMIFFAGRVAEDLSQGVEGQTRQILTTFDRLLRLAGSHKSRILSANVWLADIRTREEMNSAWVSWADPDNLPVRATVEAKLGSPQMLVEIMMVAAKLAGAQ